MNRDMKAFAQEKGYLAVLSQAQLAYCMPEEIVLEFPAMPCRFKDHDDGILSLNACVKMVPQGLEALAIPLTYWKTERDPTVPRFQLRQNEVSVLEMAGLAKSMALQLNNAFTRYALADLENFSNEDVQKIINLSSVDHEIAYHTTRILHVKFQAVSCIEDVAHQTNLAAERKRQELVILHAKEKHDLYVEQQRMEVRLQVEKLDLERKIESLEHAKNMEAVQLEAATCELALKHQQLEHIELQVSKVRQEILHLEEDTCLGKEFNERLQACKQMLSDGQTAQEHYSKEMEATFNRFTALFVGMSSTVHELKDVVGELTHFPQAMVQVSHALSQILERLDTITSQKSIKTDQEANLETIISLCKNIADLPDKQLKSKFTALMSAGDQALQKSLQSTCNRLDLLQAIREAVRNDVLDHTTPLGISMLLKGGHLVFVDRQPVSARAVSMACETIRVGNSYKLVIDVPNDGYLWLFHFGRERDVRPHLLYPFIQAGTTKVISHGKLKRGSSLVFPDDIIHVTNIAFKEEQSSGEPGKEFTAYVALLCSEPVNLLKGTSNQESFEVDVAEGPMQDYSGILHVEATTIHDIGSKIVGCGMLEYRVE